jgi:hypothetical protein
LIIKHFLGNLRFIGGSWYYVVASKPGTNAQAAADAELL